MKADIYKLDGKKSGTINLPKQFSEKIRPDLIRKANEVIESNKRQSYGAYLGAGTRASVDISRRRRNFKGAYGKGMSRVPRKTLWRRGTQFGWVAAFGPNVVSGRRAHPPKGSKDYSKKINKKENRLAIRSAISSTVIPDAVKLRGHLFVDLISVIEGKAESISKTKEFVALLEKLNLHEELARVAERKVRHGRGKMRNRKYKGKKGPLIVVSKNCSLSNAAINVEGVDICEVKNLNVNILAPGGNPGRLTIFTEEAIKKMESDNLFFTNQKKTKQEPEKKEIKKENVKKQPAIKKAVKK